MDPSKDLPLLHASRAALFFAAQIQRAFRTFRRIETLTARMGIMGLSVDILRPSLRKLAHLFHQTRNLVEPRRISVREPHPIDPIVPNPHLQRSATDARLGPYRLDVGPWNASQKYRTGGSLNVSPLEAGSLGFRFDGQHRHFLGGNDQPLFRARTSERNIGKICEPEIAVDQSGLIQTTDQDSRNKDGIGSVLYLCQPRRLPPTIEQRVSNGRLESLSCA